MKQGVTFPPIVIFGENILVDGNTRVAAAKRGPHPHVAGVHVQVPER